MGSLDKPDFILMDIDPYECGFDRVVEATLLVKKKLDAIGLAGYPKTTGGGGMHVYVPVELDLYLRAGQAVRGDHRPAACSGTSEALHDPARGGKAGEGPRLFRLMQIAESKTISAPYVVRARPGATVSTPLAWDEVNAKLHPSQFTMMNTPARFAERGDLFAGVIEKPQRLEKAFANLEKLIGGSRTR